MYEINIYIPRRLATIIVIMSLCLSPKTECFSDFIETVSTLYYIVLLFIYYDAVVELVFTLSVYSQ